MFDPSNGYERVAQQFIDSRLRSNVGVQTVRTWCRTLPKGGTVLDLGCGSGVPVTQTLMAEGLTVYGVEASPTLCEVFRRNFPDAPVACELAEL